MHHTKNLTLIALGVLAIAFFSHATPAHAATYTEANVRIMVHNEQFFADTVYVSSDGCTVVDDAGATHTIVGTKAICALVAAAGQGEFSYAFTHYSGFGLLLSNVNGQSGDWTNYWMYYVNTQSPSVGMGDLDMHDGDELLLTFGGYTPPLRLTLDRTHRKNSASVQALVESYVYDYLTNTGSYQPVVGASVTVSDRVFMTDSFGVAALQLDSAGAHTVSATAEGYTRTAETTLYGYRSFQSVRRLGRVVRAQHSQSGLAYLQSQQGVGGLIGQSQSVTEWAAMAVAAVGGVDAEMTAAVKAYKPTAAEGASEIARHILALQALGVDARNAEGIDFVARLKKTIHAGQFGDTLYCNDDIFAVLALISAHEPMDSQAIAGGVNQTLNCVNSDGGVGYAVGGSTDMDTTAAWLMMALRLQGYKKEHGIALREYRLAAKRFIRSAQHPDGGWGYTAKAASNSSTTAWVLQALRSGGKHAKYMTTNHRNGFDYLHARIDSTTGAVAYDAAGSTSLEVLNTAYAMMAFAGKPMPVNVQAPR